MDQLYTYEILQELRDYDCYDFFKDIVWPAVITLLTIWSAVLLSKREYSRTFKAQKSREEADRHQLNKIILRNARKIIEKAREESTKFLNHFVDGYNIEKGIMTRSMLYVFPELDMLASIEKLRFELTFLGHESSDDEVAQLYLAIAGITAIKDSYDEIGKEVEKINSFIGNYDTILISEFENVGRFMELNFEKYNAIKADDRLSKQDLEEFYSLFSGYKSDINNFHELKEILERLPSSNVFKKTTTLNFIEYTHVESAFMLAYYKYQQEVLLFHGRIRFLSNRIIRSCFQLETFVNNQYTKQTVTC